MGTRWSRRGVVTGLVLLPMVVAAGAAGTSAASGAAPRLTKTFASPGKFTWKVPAGVTKVTFTVYGASGGNVTTGSPVSLLATGGPGGVTTATVTVRPGTVFGVVVGGRGGDSHDLTRGIGGFNLGGFGAAGGGATAAFAGAGGGGASDIRLATSGKKCALNCGIGSRIIVAGGGGGASADAAGAAGGGAGGGLSGVQGGGGPSTYGEGGTQDSGTGYDPGGFGLGATGGSITTGLDGGGGGGGWIGGGGGGPVDGTAPQGGGGGSGYFSAFAVSGSFLAATQIGDGRVVIKTA